MGDKVRIGVMKRYLIPILIIFVLVSGVLGGCTCVRITPQKQSTTELEDYLAKASPIMKRHVETTETGNEANRA